jgi:large repetitive protein
MCRRHWIFLVLFISPGFSGRAEPDRLTEVLQNIAPVITGQDPLSIQEDASLTLALSDLQVTDPDNNYPDDFSLTVSAGENYTFDGTTISPAANFNGTLYVPVFVNDGTSDSPLFNVEITVTPVNDKPVITGHVPLQTSEDQALTLTLEDLIVSDPDNAYPTDFTLSISGGSNYSVSGTTITPDPEFNGFLAVQVTVHDGMDASDSFSLVVEVTSQNDPPVITGQLSADTPEDTPFTITPAHLTVSDPDNEYPGDFSLAVLDGTDYTVSGTTVTPRQDFTGTLSVPVTVNDGGSTSEPFNFVLLVGSANDPPLITSQVAAETPEETSFVITLQHLTVSDSDNEYPAGFSLLVSEGGNYTIAGTTITPIADFTGTLSIPVMVNDGTENSAPFDFLLQVAAVNDPPVITGQVSAETPEETPFSITLQHLTVSDPDNPYPDGFSLSVSEGENYTLSGTMVTPATDFTGTLSIPVTVNDGTSQSEVFAFVLQVGSQNDPPQITGQVPLSVNEEEPLAIDISYLTVTDPDNAAGDLTLTVSQGTNYVLQGNTVIPASDFTGSLTVAVSVSDGTSSSAPFDLAISVLPVNDAPMITSQVALSVNEETPLTLQLSDFVVADPDNTYPGGFSLSVGTGENYTVTGTTITPVTDFSGTLAVPVTVNDGTASSPVFNAQVTVGNVNDKPEITGQVALVTNEEQPLTIQLSHLTVMDNDHTYPQGFTLTVMAGTGYTVSGTSITPVKDYNGQISIPVTVNDGVSASDPFALQVTVSPVNDVPVITSQAALATYRNKPLTLVLTDLIVQDPDNSYPDGFSMIVGSGQNYNVYQSTITPANNFVGMLTIPVTVSDGAATSAVFSLKLNVEIPPNVKPEIVSQVKLTTYMNEPLLLQLSHLVVSDPDNRFPDDFTMAVYGGTHYTLNGYQIVPETDYSGYLNVKVTVSDKELVSDPFIVTVEVLPVTVTPLITSQAFIRTTEDGTLVLKFSDINVSDPDDNYPTGFTMAAAPGANYSLSGLELKPAPDFNGYLSVPVTVNDGEHTSIPYELRVLVDPVNDPPVVTDSDPATVFYSYAEDFYVFRSFSILDVDNDTLSSAVVEIGSNFERGRDTLIFENTASVRGIYDGASGTLVIFGNGTVGAYQDFLNRIVYKYKGNVTGELSKVLTVSVNDGNATSGTVDKTVLFDFSSMQLDIPGGFTPNGDGTNDTWSIRSSAGETAFENAVVRVYNKRGVLVFESTGLGREWDGKFNGSSLPADSYFYTIDLHNPFGRNRYKGVVTILR